MREASGRSGDKPKKNRVPNLKKYHFLELSVQGITISLRSETDGGHIPTYYEMIKMRFGLSTPGEKDYFSRDLEMSVQNS